MRYPSVEGDYEKRPTSYTFGIEDSFNSMISHCGVEIRAKKSFDFGHTLGEFVAYGKNFGPSHVSHNQIDDQKALWIKTTCYMFAY